GGGDDEGGGGGVGGGGGGGGAGGGNMTIEEPKQLTHILDPASHSTKALKVLGWSQGQGQGQGQRQGQGKGQGQGQGQGQGHRQGHRQPPPPARLQPSQSYQNGGVGTGAGAGAEAEAGGETRAGAGAGAGKRVGAGGHSQSHNQNPGVGNTVQGGVGGRPAGLVSGPLSRGSSLAQGAGGGGSALGDFYTMGCVDGGGSGGEKRKSTGGSRGAKGKFPYRRRLREGLDAAYKNRCMLFCMQEALLYAQGLDPICPERRPRWWPSPWSGRQIRAGLVGVGAGGGTPLTAEQMRLNLFGSAEPGAEAEDSPVRADGTRLPPMMVLPLRAMSKRFPLFSEGSTVPVSTIPRRSLVVWISHIWLGTPSRPDDRANSKAKALYEGLKEMGEGRVYVWIDRSCLPDPISGDNVDMSPAARGAAASSAAAALRSPVAMAATEAEAAEQMGRRARTIRGLPLYLLCCDFLLTLNDKMAYRSSPWSRLERAALQEARQLTCGRGLAKGGRLGHPRLLHMEWEEVISQSVLMF
ncbi:unnamed protein product, partial [Discosporangium mesarthrocarpum]